MRGAETSGICRQDAAAGNHHDLFGGKFIDPKQADQDCVQRRTKRRREPEHRVKRDISNERSHQLSAEDSGAKGDDAKTGGQDDEHALSPKGLARAQGEDER